MSHTTNTPPSRPNDILSITTIFASLIFIFVTIITTLLIGAIRYLPKVFNNPFSLHARAPVLQLLASWGLCFQLIAWAFVATVPDMNCGTVMILSNLGWYSLMVSILLRAWRLYFIFHWNAREIKEILKQEREEKKISRAKSLMGGIGAQIVNPGAYKRLLFLGNPTQSHSHSNSHSHQVQSSHPFHASGKNSNEDKELKETFKYSKTKEMKLEKEVQTIENEQNESNEPNEHCISIEHLKSLENQQAEHKFSLQNKISVLKNENSYSEQLKDSDIDNPISDMKHTSLLENIHTNSTTSMLSSNRAIHPQNTIFSNSTDNPVLHNQSLSLTGCTTKTPHYNTDFNSSLANSEQYSFSYMGDDTLPTQKYDWRFNSSPDQAFSQISPLQLDQMDQPQLHAQRQEIELELGLGLGQDHMNLVRQDESMKQSPQGIFGRIRQTSTNNNQHANINVNTNVNTNLNVSPFTLSENTNSILNTNANREFSQQTNSKFINQTVSPIQGFSLAPHTQTLHSMNSMHEGNNFQPPLSPTLTLPPDSIPSMGHLNLTYKDPSSHLKQYHNFVQQGEIAFSLLPQTTEFYNVNNFVQYNGLPIDTPFDDVIENDEDITYNDSENINTRNEEIVSDWIEILQFHEKESTANINKRRANEKNLLIFFFIGFFPILFFLIPTALFMPKYIIPHSFLCDINQYAFPTSELLPSNPNQFPIIEFLLSIISVFLVFVAIIKLRKVRDTYHLNTELRVLSFIVVLGVFLYGVIIPLFSFMIIVPFVLFFLWYVLLLIPMIYYPYVYMFMHWGRTCFKCLRRNKKNIDAIVQNVHNEQNDQQNIKKNLSTFDGSSLDYIMRTQILKNMLKKHMVHSLCSELITFYEQVSIFRITYDDKFPDASLKQANTICDTYIYEDGPKPIRLPKQMRNEILETMQIAVDYVPVDIFDNAARYVTNKIRKDGTFSSFKRSKRFRKWLKQQEDKKIERVVEKAGGLVEPVSI